MYSYIPLGLNQLLMQSWPVVSYLYSGHLPVRLNLGQGSLLLVDPLFHFRQCHSGLVPSRNEHVCPCHLMTRSGQISSVWSLSQKVFTGFTTLLLHVFIASAFRCVENMGLRGPIFGPLWAQNKQKFRSLIIFSKIFHWFRISLGIHVNLSYFYRCVDYWPQRPISRSF